MPLLQQIIDEVHSLANPERAKLSAKYFQCFVGGYGHGDTFIGLTTPQLRAISQKHKHTNTDVVFELLHNPIHEIRLLCLYILVLQFASAKTPVATRTKICNYYYNNLQYINNWDLVDVSAHKLLGPTINNNNVFIIEELALCQNLWKNRVAIISTFYHIKQQQFDIPLKIAHMLLHHKHDLIHKAVGWALREIGNIDPQAEVAFLKQHYHTMPRTMLRYAIEKFDEPERQLWLKGTV
jgi:3-methyladenine DNA glycosylase AlkD